ncbi:xanthine dehydrogenase family protein molybdopterin-binding subunit [Marinobacter sp. F3R08]|uniref:xanthine dehydrogenase family protein molybdopterin-binding subunit n=1 Tax=Marinobacter sp. F3R08 TaxID=2841559 RepID=UPI001C07F84B|nr:xanthine dehydrogenase family protein molybdopterin-binding subunit [Marinobacter sp. F3R08]MBU2955878.1 xanthine dehydrogenase family protein molybdopterin-binding subunit [Marinobacter sp. F3R08]
MQSKNDDNASVSRGVGASKVRKEDDRYMRGLGDYVGDMKMPGMLEVAFLRSPVAHGYLKHVTKPTDADQSVFVAEDLVGVKGILANSALPGFKSSEQPILAKEKVRYVGELVAACIAPDRARAEDLADNVELDIENLAAVSDMLGALDEEAPLVHEHWGDNVFQHTLVDGDLESIRSNAAIKIEREYRTARQCMSPMEGRGVLAFWDSRLEQLQVYTSTQMPHIVRTGLSECLGLDHEQIRVVAPDVGGGFGYKGILLPEEVCVAWLAMHFKRPVRWLEDRREQLTANANCREHYYRVTAYGDETGRLLALDTDAVVDAGAYSSYPFSACLEGAQVASILPGPYDFQAYRCSTVSASTNKPPILPYRGVARTGVCFAMELTMDALARAVGREPSDVRLDCLVKPENMPFDNITGKHFDSGDYPDCLRRAVEAIDLKAVRQRQETPEADGRLIGVGMSIFCEQSAHGTSVYAGWGIPMVPGHEQAEVRLTPDGSLEIRVGIHSHGQGLETTLAQVAEEVLGIDTDRVRVVHGDTALTPYSTGTWGSRCMVMAGGAVARACTSLSARVATIGAHLLEVPVESVVVADGTVSSPQSVKTVTLQDVARTWYLKPQLLPENVDAGGLEVTAGYKPERDSGTFSYACHAVVVAVDPELGTTEILDYAIVEDGGVLVNPMIVDGQVYGGVAQGIGSALYEEMPFDKNGQPLASTLADYLLPGATEVPEIAIDHMETPSPYTEFGQKGIGESGAIGPPAAIVNAINDALRPLNAEISEVPVTPQRMLGAILKAQLAKSEEAA